MRDAIVFFSHSRISLKPLIAIGFALAVLLQPAIVILRSTRWAKKNKDNWIVVYWPLLLLAFDFVVLYAIMMTQTGSTRTIGLVITSITAVPVGAVIVMLVYSAIEDRKVNLVTRDIGSDAEVAVVRVHDHGAL